ncbi:MULTISPECIES: hypothetical protein [unclassified Rhizobium]|uniref:hypothetical protein n=1 Tax=unclassified Rhizobium TaxID=2613769 RepID=UPI000BD15CBC|nr:MULTISPECIES: hypothetical protein [unclassified Rhizobium]MDH7805721.1 hypothetical protein [Rhizobium sp. AN67]MDQ4407195.1 hypothetical protein [Rhizobium sp. AN63]SOD59787.1 hypothetical protein SAMN05216595_4953 [Rhizobium sp. AN6A]
MNTVKRSRPHHEEPQKYIAYVLWLIGHPYSTIGRVLHLKRSQVGGIITRSEYAGRTSMTIAERNELLQEPEEIRMEEGRPLDGGILDRIPFTAIR